MNFSDALKCIKDGQRVTRDGWARGLTWIGLVTDWNGNFGGPLSPLWRASDFIALRAFGDGMEPWTPTSGDLLANDWRVVELDESLQSTTEEPA